MKNLNTQKNNAKAVMLLIATTFLIGNKIQSQTRGSIITNDFTYDILKINSDNSNHYGELRLQSRDRAFTFSNYSNRMSLQFEISNDVRFPGPEVFSIDTEGYTTMGNAYVGDMGYGNSWAGFAHKDQGDRFGYALLTHTAGTYTHLNKKNTGDGYIGFRVGNADKMVILNNGNVGIGTIDPTEKLNVLGNILASGNIQANNTVIIGQSQLSSITENENTLLTVTGGVKTDKVVLNIGSFPDYVFESDYKLMPIGEVANYIAKNKHLPNIPAEKEMMATGMDMQMISLKLVEKIEELTLYTIQQEEKLEAQDQLILALTKRLDDLEKKEVKQ